MKSARSLTLLLAAVLVATAFAQAQTTSQPVLGESSHDSAAIKQLVKRQCGACHGDDGNATKSSIPKLAGQHADYLYKQLRNFKAADGKPMGPSNPMYPTPSDLVYVAVQDGKLPERMNPVYFLAMNGMVKDLSDADMKAIAVYFSAQSRKLDEVISRPEDIETAQRLYRAGDAQRGLAPCAGCHGPNGAGLPAQFPRLSGQFATYTAAQLKNFRAGYRTNDPNGMMRDVSSKLTETEIMLLSDFIAGLR